MEYEREDSSKDADIKCCRLVTAWKLIFINLISDLIITKGMPSVACYIV